MSNSGEKLLAQLGQQAYTMNIFDTAITKAFII